MFIAVQKGKKKLTDTELDSKIKSCVYQEIDRRVLNGLGYELTSDLTQWLIESKLQRLLKQREALQEESR